MDYSSDQAEVALYVFDEFLKFLINIKLRPTSTRLYCALENGPHIQGGWEVKFELSGNQILRQIGIAVGWLMCNRQGLSVFLHPVTWKPGDVREEYRAHSEYCMFIGSLPDLDLNFFLNQSNPQ
jgi:aromatic ring-cleaving dioxygenase